MRKLETTIENARDIQRTVEKKRTPTCNSITYLDWFNCRFHISKAPAYLSKFLQNATCPKTMEQACLGPIIDPHWTWAKFHSTYLTCAEIKCTTYPQAIDAEKLKNSSYSCRIFKSLSSYLLRQYY